MSNSNNKIILKNTIFLYFRTFILLILGLYTSRVTMQALGVENYGIINVVSGFVSMFALVSGALTGACQRFITFELGKKDGNVTQIFSSTFYIQVGLATLIIILAETIGLYFINYKLNLPDGKLDEAQWVFQCSVISFVFSLINIPYNAIIIAHEKMKAFAYISLVEAFLKLATVYSILILPYNSLILYSLLTLISSTIVRFVYQIYCIKSFKDEVRLERVKDMHNFRNIFNFAGWAFIGNSATILNGQGINIILNIFVGVTINAARGIASMIESTVSSFVYNFTTALNPQITKAYAQNDSTRLYELLNLGTRLSFFLMIVITTPIIIITPNLLKLWLTVYPEYSIPFIRITLIIAIVQAMANPFVTAICATGKIRDYQLTVGLLTIANFPICYILLKIGLDPVWIYVASLIMYIITFIIRLIFVRNRVKIPVGKFYIIVLSRLIPILIIGLTCSFYISKVINTDNWLGLIFYSVISSIVTIILIYIIGLQNSERKQVIDFIYLK